MSKLCRGCGRKILNRKDGRIQFCEYCLKTAIEVLKLRKKVKN